MKLECNQCKSLIDFGDVTNLEIENASLQKVEESLGIEESYQIVSEDKNKVRLIQQEQEKNLEGTSIQKEIPENVTDQKPSKSEGKKNNQVQGELNRLFKVISTVTKSEHPLCINCSAKLRENLDFQIRQINEEVDAYQNAIKDLQQDIKRVDVPKLQQEVRDLKRADEQESKEIAKLEQDYLEECKQLEKLQEQESQILKLEQDYWHDHNDFQQQLENYVQGRDSLANKTQCLTNQLYVLQCTDVFDDVFNISFNGPFGTISKFRLGTTAQDVVPNYEINAAWGQATLLLHAMARDCDFSFQQYVLKPYGSFSQVADKKGNLFHLYQGESLAQSISSSIGLSFSSYNKAMIGYLQCLKEFTDYLANQLLVAQGRVRNLPNMIEQDKVHGLSIQRKNNDVKWSKALKLMLVNLKTAVDWFLKLKNHQQLNKT